MRPVVVFVIPLLAVAPASAGSSAWMQGRPALPAPRIDLNPPGEIGPPSDRGEDSDVLLSKPLAPPPAIEKSILPSVDVGPFHATVGGMNGGRTHLGSYELDTRDFWNSSISGSVDSRGARITFTLPTH
jgi:hypothetical protein